LATYRPFWKDSLDRLDQHLSESQETKG